MTWTSRRISTAIGLTLLTFLGLYFYWRTVDRAIPTPKKTDAVSQPKGSAENSALTEAIEKAASEVLIIARISAASQNCGFHFDDAAAQNLYKAALTRSGAGVSSETITKLSASLSKSTETNGSWCDDLAKEGARLGVLKDPETIKREEKEAREAAARKAKEDKERAAREAAEEKERALREAKEEKERALREAREEKERAAREAREAREAAAEAARERREGIKNGSIVVLSASDLAAQTHKWDGKQIITTLSCFYADTDEYRCVGGGARVDFSSLEPSASRERIERNCDTISKSISRRCKVRVQFEYAGYTEMETGGFFRKLTVVLPAAGLGTIISE